MRGHRESEELVYCNFVYELILVPFQVRESSTTPTAAA